MCNGDLNLVTLSLSEWLILKNGMLLNGQGLTWCLGEHNLENVYSPKILRVTYSSDCSLHAHVNTIIATSRRAIYMYAGARLT